MTPSPPESGSEENPINLISRPTSPIPHHRHSHRISPYHRQQTPPAERLRAYPPITQGELDLQRVYDDLLDLTGIVEHLLERYRRPTRSVSTQTDPEPQVAVRSAGPPRIIPHPYPPTTYQGVRIYLTTPTPQGGSTTEQIPNTSIRIYRHTNGEYNQIYIRGTLPSQPST